MHKAYIVLLARALFFYALLLALYIILWNGIVSGVVPFPTNMEASKTVSNSYGSEQNVNIIATADMKIYRYGFLPVYWSRIGNLLGYHQLFFAVLTVELIVALAVKYRRCVPFSQQKFLKPKPVIPTHGDDRTMKRNIVRAIIVVWAFIGMAWFLLYQLLTVLPYDLSFLLVEGLNYLMWMVALVSAGLFVHHYLKLLYHKMWGLGGEK